jgi:hypothetical protein
MMSLFLEIIAYFENSAVADAIRENDVLFPTIESVHVVAICLVVGSILVLDLRLLGFASMRRIRRRGNFRLSALHLQCDKISREWLFRRKDTFDRSRRLEHDRLPFDQRKGFAALGEGPLAAAARTARGRVLHSALDRSRRLRTLDRLHHAGTLTCPDTTQQAFSSRWSLRISPHRRRDPTIKVQCRRSSLMSTSRRLWSTSYSRPRP